jgi:lauroyl/myristoyl acyltransferase
VGLAIGPRLGRAWTPSAAEVTDVLGDLGSAQTALLRRRIAAAELRNRTLTYVVKQRGPEPILPLIRVHDTGGFQRLRDDKIPVIVVFFHQGVLRAAETALTMLHHPILLACTHPPRGPDPGFRWRVVADMHSGTRYLMDALRELKRGGVPVLALDGDAGLDAPRVPFFDRNIWVPTGPAILSRRSGARLVPVTSRWVGASAMIEVTLHEPIPEPTMSRSEPSAWDRELLANTSLWFERHLRAHPAELRPLNFRESYRGMPPGSAPPAA